MYAYVILNNIIVIMGQQMPERRDIKMFIIFTNIVSSLDKPD